MYLIRPLGKSTLGRSKNNIRWFLNKQWTVLYYLVKSTSTLCVNNNHFWLSWCPSQRFLRIPNFRLYSRLRIYKRLRSSVISSSQRFLGFLFSPSSSVHFFTPLCHSIIVHFPQASLLSMWASLTELIKFTVFSLTIWQFLYSFLLRTWLC